MKFSGDFDDYHAGNRLQRRRIKCVPSLSTCFASITAFVAMMLLATLAFKTCNYYMKACPKRTEPCPPEISSASGGGGGGTTGGGTTGCTSSGGPCGSNGDGQCTFSCSDVIKGSQNNTYQLAQSIIALSNVLINERSGGNCTTTTPAPTSAVRLVSPTQGYFLPSTPTPTPPPKVTERPSDLNVSTAPNITTTQRPTVSIDFEVNVVGVGHWSEGVIISSSTTSSSDPSDSTTPNPPTTSEPETEIWVEEVIGIGSAGGFPEDYLEDVISSTPIPEFTTTSVKDKDVSSISSTPIPESSSSSSEEDENVISSTPIPEFTTTSVKDKDVSAISSTPIPESETSSEEENENVIFSTPTPESETLPLEEDETPPSEEDETPPSEENETPPSEENETPPSEEDGYGE